MQQQQWAGYSFYGAYPPTTPYPPHPQNLPPNTGAYPPFYPQHPPVDPAPFEFNAEAYTRQAKAQHRRTFTAPVPPPKQPLKPALKKAMTIFQSADNPLSRQRSNPQSTSQHMLSRQRTRSNPAPPDSVMTNPELSTYHMLVSFNNLNELKIENYRTPAIQELGAHVWKILPSGVESEGPDGRTYYVRFRNSPWDLGGPYVKETYKFIVAFFTLFQRRGFTFQTTVGTGTPNPRLLFQVTQPDPTSVFFLAYFSQEGRRFTLIDPPPTIELTLLAKLRTTLRHAVGDTESAAEDGTRVIELRRHPNTNAPLVDPIIFYVEILKALADMRFNLEASLPFIRRGSLGMRHGREILVFRGTPQS